jgi:hypothetical protein
MAFSIKESIGEMINDKELDANIKNVSQGLPRKNTDEYFERRRRSMVRTD